MADEDVWAPDPKVAACRTCDGWGWLMVQCTECGGGGYPPGAMCQSEFCGCCLGHGVEPTGRCLTCNPLQPVIIFDNAMGPC